jgi:type IV secretion system protein VirB2
MSEISEHSKPKSDFRIPIIRNTLERNFAMHHPCTRRLTGKHNVARLLLTFLVSIAPELALAQASPFMTGATALQTNILAWLTPVAIILVMVLGGMAMANRMSWGWCIGAILGIAIAFGAPQIVTWVRGMFGV